MAERGGFEPPDQLPGRILSKDVLSAAQPPLHCKFLFYLYAEGLSQTCAAPKWNWRSSKVELAELQSETGGGGGIRTHERFPFNGFQDHRLRPLGHPS